MFTFVKNLPQLENLESITTSKGRTYITPDGNKYISVTTFLSSLTSDKINEWKNKVGEDIAEQIASKARHRGTRYHDLIEKYLRSGDRKQLLREIMPNMKQMFLDSEETINKINNIHYIEQTLYSDKLKLAGRVDVIGEFDDKLSIIDFKTSTKEKFESEIENYFLQTTIYAMMYEELTNFKIDQIVIIMICDDLMKPIVFKTNPNKYTNLILNKINDYHKGI